MDNSSSNGSDSVVVLIKMKDFHELINSSWEDGEQTRANIIVIQLVTSDEVH